MEEEFNKAIEVIDDNPDFYYSGKLDFAISKKLVAQIEVLAKEKYDKSVICNKLHFFAVEMIQNVNTHGVINGKKDVCIKSKMLDSKLYLLTENFISNKETAKFIEKLNGLNKVSSDYEKVKQLYHAVVVSYEIRGLGLISIVRKSKNKILYNLEKIDAQISKISLIATVDIK